MKKENQNWQLTMCKINYQNLYMLFVIYIVPPKPTYRHIIYGEILEMKIILRVSVQQSRWMIKLVQYVNWDIREKTSCCDIIETNTVNKSLKRRDAVSQIEGYTPPPPTRPPSPAPTTLYPYRAYIEALLSYGPLSLYEWKELKKTIPLFEDREPELRTMDNKVTEKIKWKRLRNRTENCQYVK